MARAPTPLFETYDNFIEQDFSLQGSSLACVASFLNECQAALEPDRGYAAVRAFLRAFSDNAQTLAFDSAGQSMPMLATPDGKVLLSSFADERMK
ncbi:TPA: hypothetical protein ABHN85_24245 [Pseudomonas sp. H2]|uniref:hypothetical protein n=1 Tax=Pseudomonas sp. H2 TaxID=658612 RepID=UPI000513960A|nr:hypothetical protein [Pseudomonas sp. H2]KGI91345.1 hypothetical protein MD26_21240 [Pseudomonas sp. H2]